ncbi:DAK2 domain-containing protein [Bacillus sp. 03113]|uniref:DAK2 domain-containing protein n=1 Tax=Bacillus sp. 03113 TaxID=2578211 RepID=UPI001143E608|nr:DAK2 domain-containing protein [Bacillus sp. 03113]
MSITVLDGKRFAEMIIQGANYLSSNAKYVDALNVFPVPDGDTGTNMSLSITSGAKEVQNNVQNHIGAVAKSLSKGLLMGARGNSGVILSQLFRGFAKAIEQKSVLNGKEFAKALQGGVETAYKAVMKPVEGTILTVAKDSARAAVKAAENQDDIIYIMEEVVKEAKASLNRTPDLLPVLKEVGVVDSGGQGLVFVYEGLLAELKGEELPDGKLSLSSMDELVNAEHHKSVQSFINTEDIEYGYCTEFMVRFEEKKLNNHPFNEEKFRNEMSKYGDSLLVISDDEIVKVHIHSEQPGEVLNYGQQYGSLINMKIENMREQHSTIVGKPLIEAPVPAQLEEQEYGIIAVSMGSGIASLFKSMGAHVIIEGGQTMNPSTEDFVKAIKNIKAKKIIILPNNKNIIMAAEQVAEVLDEEVAVIPAKTVPQGLSALLSFHPDLGMIENKEAMTEAIKHVKSGQITFAVRNTCIDGLEIEKDDYMGIAENKIIVKNKDKVQTAYELLTKMLDEDSEILTIIKGEDASEAETAELIKRIEDEYAELEIETHAGNQPLYSFIFSVE